MADGTDANGANGDRDRSGRFRRGNRGGPGNPRARLVHEHMRAVAEAVTAEELRDLVRHLHALAMAGNVGAAGLLLDRVLGRARGPQPSVQADSPVEAAEQVLRLALSGALDPAQAAELLRVVEAVVDLQVLAQLEQRVAQLELGR